MRFLIDECLHTSLTKIANERGYECQHVVHCGLSSCPDHEIVRYTVRNDFVLVTNNADDFRRLYQKEALHPGLVVIVPMVAPVMQRTLLQAALDAIGDNEPVNMIVEANLIGGRPSIAFLRWPPISRL